MVMEVFNVSFEQHDVGAVSFDTNTGLGAFEYAPSFIKTGIELAPLKMPLASRIYNFPELDFNGPRHIECAQYFFYRSQ